MSQTKVKTRIARAIMVDNHDNLEAEVLDVPIAVAEWLRVCRDIKDGKFVGSLGALMHTAEKAILEIEDGTMKLCASAEQQTMDLRHNLIAA